MFAASSLAMSMKITLTLFSQNNAIFLVFVPYHPFFPYSLKIVLINSHITRCDYIMNYEISELLHTYHTIYLTAYMFQKKNNSEVCVPGSQFTLGLGLWEQTGQISAWIPPWNIYLSKKNSFIR